MNMDKVYLVSPAMEHKDAYNEMMVEWEEEKGHIYPGVIRRKGTDYSSWLETLELYRKRETCPPHLSPSDTFFLVNENNSLLGAISIRHYLSEQLLKLGGHIGYGIRPTERRKGYATEMLKLALEKCRYMGIEQVLITCDKDNIGSSKTIIANNGVLENEIVEDNGNIVQRYWISIK
ncbi:acetyltransferase [Clostridium folliculivorans]|nr:acetyltransferase [Clostridium folliculivorans]